MENSWEKPKNTFFITYLAIAICLSVALSAFMFNIINQTYAAGTATANCPSTYLFKINSVYGSATPLTTYVTGVVPIDFSALNTDATFGTVQKVTILADNNPIGIARPTATANYWQMPWATSLLPYGIHNMYAEATTSSGIVCKTMSINASITSFPSGNLAITAQPTTWSGYSNTTQSILISPTVYATGNSFNATNYAIYEYAKTIGNITPNDIAAQFYPGGTVGSGNVTVTAKYGGVTSQIAIPIHVMPTPTPVPTPTPLPTPTLTPTPTKINTGTNNTVISPTPTKITTVTPTPSPTPAALTQAAQTKAAVVAASPVVQTCAQTALGTEKYSAINNGAARPTAEEVIKLKSCYVSSNYIIPSNFAPISPKALSTLQIADKIEISKPVNEDKTINNTKKQILKFSGKAKANATVILYLFSDPLVLVTTSDSNGNWSYSLEDPIETGKHEVYAVVDRGDGVYEKSSPFDFVIGKATAASGNPENLSLTLADTATPAQSNRSTLIYVVGSAFVVLIIGLAALFVILNINRKKSKNSSNINQQPPTFTPPPPVFPTQA